MKTKTTHTTDAPSDLEAALTEALAQANQRSLINDSWLYRPKMAQFLLAELRKAGFEIIDVNDVYLPSQNR